MDVSLEGEESKFISLYSSDYIRESIDSIAYMREQRKNQNKMPQQELNNANGIDSGSHRMTSANQRDMKHESQAWNILGGQEHQKTRSQALQGDKKLSAQRMETLLQYNQSALIFQHPPSKQNFPQLYRDCTFWQK